MPSWNIHTAHVERLLAEGAPSDFGIHDVGSFLFGNYAPDVYVGYMVEHPTKVIDYRTTHLADPQRMPEPHYQEFWERFALPSADGTGRVSDVVLGAWIHLMTDCLYNHRVNQWISERHLAYGDPLRVRKQHDFDTFGHTLRISMVADVTPELLVQCAHFPQYTIEEPDVRAAVQVAQGIVTDTRIHHIQGMPTYSLLTSHFFEAVFDEVDATITAALHRYVQTISSAL